MSYSELDLNLIRTFVVVYESKSILSASKKLYISQPAITKSIKRLESFLGGELFVRTSKGLINTTEGNQFYQACVNSINGINNAISQFSSYSKLESGALNIGSSSTIIRRLLLPFISEFSARYPNIKISVTDAISTALVQHLKAGDVDLVIMNTPVENSSSLVCTPITQTEDCFVASVSFPHDFVDKNDLKKFPIILQKRPSNNRDFFEQLCEENSIYLSANYEIGSFGLITDFAQKNMGIAFTIKDFVQDDIDSGKIKEVKTNFKIKQRDVVALTNENAVNSFACQSFINEVVEYFKINEKK